METEPVAEAPAVENPWFDLPNILWFFGAFTAAAASQTVISEVPSSSRSIWVLLASLAFLAGFAVLAVTLLQADWWVPGGVLVAMAVTFVVPATIAFEQLIGYWEFDLVLNPLQQYEGPAVVVFIALAAAGLGAFTLVRFHFILAIVAVATFVLAQLLVPLVISEPSPTEHATAVLLTGLGLIAVGLTLDLAVARREAFWWHFVGLLALTVGLAYHAFRNTSWGWIMILLAGIAILLLGASLRRATWGVFGVAGSYAPVVHYLDSWFGNLGAALALTVLGLGMVALGIGARVYGDAVPAFRRRTPAVG